MCESSHVRFRAAAAAGVIAAGSLVAAPPAAAGPTVCDVPDCTPGIMPGVVLGSPCDSTTYYVFGVTDWGRLVFCGSPRRYDPRWFRSPVMRGIKDENSNCENLGGPGRAGARRVVPDLCVDQRSGALAARRHLSYRTGLNVMWMSVSPRRMNVGSYV